MKERIEKARKYLFGVLMQKKFVLINILMIVNILYNLYLSKFNINYELMWGNFLGLSKFSVLIFLIFIFPRKLLLRNIYMKKNYKKIMRGLIHNVFFIKYGVFVRIGLGNLPEIIGLFYLQIGYFYFKRGLLGIFFGKRGIIKGKASNFNFYELIKYNFTRFLEIIYLFPAKGILELIDGFYDLLKHLETINIIEYIKERMYFVIITMLFISICGVSRFGFIIFGSFMIEFIHCIIDSILFLGHSGYDVKDYNEEIFTSKTFSEKIKYISSKGASIGAGSVYKNIYHDHVKPGNLVNQIDDKRMKIVLDLRMGYYSFSKMHTKLRLYSSLIQSNYYSNNTNEGIGNYNFYKDFKYSYSKANYKLFQGIITKEGNYNLIMGLETTDLNFIIRLIVSNSYDPIEIKKYVFAMFLSVKENNIILEINKFYEFGEFRWVAYLGEMVLEHNKILENKFKYKNIELLNDTDILAVLTYTTEYFEKNQNNQKYIEVCKYFKN